VARYCRVMVRAERPGATAAIQAQATSLEDRLGLTPKAMRLLLWTVEDQAAPVEVAGDGEVASLEDRRRRVSGA
jgi:hypothetical protein